MLLANMTLPAQPTSVVINGLTPENAYWIRAAAWTSAGLGPASAAAVYRMDPSLLSKTSAASQETDSSDGKTGRSAAEAAAGGQSNDLSAQDLTPSGVTVVVQETWFILLLGGILLAILILLIAALIVRNRLARNKALSSAVASKTNSPLDERSVLAGSGRSTVGGHLLPLHQQPFQQTPVRDVFWARGWASSGVKEAEADAQASLLPHLGGALHTNSRSVVPPSEYAELLGHAGTADHHLSLSSFLPRRTVPQQQHPAAYATTTLVTQRSGGGIGGSTFSSSPHPNSTSDSSEYATDELGGGGERQRRTYNGKQPLRQHNSTKLPPNLGDLLPPPPRHPPPPPSSPAVDRRNNTSSPVVHVSSTSSPAMSKRSTPVSMALLNGGGSGGGSSCGSRRSQEKQLVQENVDANEYAYAYHTPLDNVYPRMNAYNRPLNNRNNASTGLDRGIQSSLCNQQTDSGTLSPDDNYYESAKDCYDNIRLHQDQWSGAYQEREVNHSCFYELPAQKQLD